MYRVIATFKNKSEAAESVRELLDYGYSLNEISLIIKSKRILADEVPGETVHLRLSKIGILGDIADFYNEKIEEGHILLAVPVDHEQERGLVTVIFDDNNAREIRTVGDFRFSKLLVRR